MSASPRLPRALFAWALLAAGCGSGAAPQLTAIEPSTVSSTSSARATLRGRNLGGAATVQLDSNDAPVLRYGWQVSIGAVALPAGDVMLMGPEALALVLPAGLPLGVHDVVAVSPRDVTLRLPLALAVVAPSPSECGDAVCEPGEDRCGCPADCGAASCGDGVCCAATGETRCTCPGDCGESTCGDGCCSPLELSGGACLADCSCGQSCALGCGGANCCTTTCTASPCAPPACACAACAYDCAGLAACETRCEGPHACQTDCTDVTSCLMRCDPGASCRLDCDKTKSCALNCRGSTCEVECRNNNNCNETRCTEGARCLIRCAAAANCSFAECTGGMSSCPNKIIVCNQPCP
jgi:hypothetical protein